MSGRSTGENRTLSSVTDKDPVCQTEHVVGLFAYVCICQNSTTPAVLLYNMCTLCLQCLHEDFPDSRQGLGDLPEKVIFLKVLLRYVT